MDGRMRPGRILLAHDTIRTRVAELGEQIARDYAGKTPLLLAVLKGAAVFCMDLMRSTSVPVELDFIGAASYGDRTESGNDAKLWASPSGDLSGKHVIVVEGIVDTGVTLQSILSHVAKARPASLEICTLLDKEPRRKVPTTLRYVGFKIQDEFVVGYGLDFNQRFRNLPDIAVLETVSGSVGER